MEAPGHVSPETCPSRCMDGVAVVADSVLLREVTWCISTAALMELPTAEVHGHTLPHTALFPATPQQLASSRINQLKFVLCST